jgi:hypothetical protein
MVRIAISDVAFSALVSTLPLGSDAYEAEIDAGGDRLIWLPRNAVDRLSALRGPGDSFSDVILKLAAVGGPDELSYLR